MELPRVDETGPLAEVVGAWPVSPAYMRTVTATWSLAVKVLESSGYQPLLPDLLPNVPRDDSAETEQIARAFRDWGERGAALPLHYHLTRASSPAQDGSPRAVVSAFSALRDADESSRQLASDSRTVREFIEALGLCFAGDELTLADSTCQVMATFVLAGRERVQIAAATDYGASPGLAAGFRAGLSEGASARLTALRFDLTGLAGLLVQQYPGLEVRR